LIDELVKYIEENNVPVKATSSFIGFGWDDIDSEDSMDNLNNMKSIQKIDSYSTIVINGNNNCSVGSLVEFLFRNALSIKLMKMNAGKYRTKFLNGYDFRKAETKLRKFTTNPNNKIYLQFLKIVDKYCIDYINYCKSVEVDTNGTDYSELARTKIGKIDEVINKKTKDMGSNLRSDFMKQQASRQQALERSSATPATPDNTSNDTVTK
jgi:hypothetical protein